MAGMRTNAVTKRACRYNFETWHGSLSMPNVWCSYLEVDVDLDDG